MMGKEIKAEAYLKQQQTAQVVGPLHQLGGGGVSNEIKTVKEPH